MRPASAIFLATVASCALASCETPASKAQKSASSASDSATALSVAVSDSANPVDLLTSRIDTTITLGAWLKSHPGDKVSIVAPVSGIGDPFCRGAVTEVKVLGRTFERSALFYIPAPPKAEKLPADTTRVAEDLCELRTIVLASEELVFNAGHAVRDSVALLVDKRLGPHRDKLPLGAGEVPGNEEGRIWNGPGTKVVVAAGPADKKATPEGDAPSDVDEGEPLSDSAKTGAVYAVAYAPGSGAQDFDTWESRHKGLAAQRASDQQTRYRDIDSALVWAALPTVTTDLKLVLAFLRIRVDDNLHESRPPQVDAALLRALKTIRDVAPSLPPQRRAAAFLAGDVTLAGTQATFSADSGSRLSRGLDSLGLTFAQVPGPDGFRNTRAWLWQAYELDSTGRAGRAAFAELLSLSWPVTAACNADEYIRMIEHGEAELSKGDNNPLIHFYVGSAYKSIYDWANFGTDEMVAPASVKAQAESARLKAIEHFRVALQSLSEPPLRREAWTKAMRLILHRSGEQPEYVCFPD
jgi:hypothetical protein